MFKLKDETLSLAVNYIDRFLEIQIIKKDKLQLIGTTALFIASKYEELHPPELNDLVYITAKSFSNKNILDMEFAMLKELNYSLTVVTENSLLSRLCFIEKIRGLE